MAISSNRSRLTAVALIGAPVFVAVGDLLAGKDPDDPAGIVSAVAASPHQFFVSRLLFFTGMALLLPGMISLLRLVPVRGHRLATVCAILTGVGAMCYGGGEFALGVGLNMLVEPGVDRSQAVIAMDHAQNDVLVNIPFMLGLFAYLGPALVGAAVVRSGAVPRLMGIALIVAPLLWFAGAVGSYTIGAVASVPLIATYAALAVSSEARESHLSPAIA